jgi:formate/nitrite transporter FocA (FNT family)
MFYIPLGIFEGTPGLSVGHYIAHSMIPSLLGNIVGGGVSFLCVSMQCVRLVGLANVFCCSCSWVSCSGGW